MTSTKDANSSHVEDVNAQHEALLTGAVALASLFSSCVEAFGLVHPQHKWEKGEQLLLTRLGLQQARLLIWGQVLGISSPPAAVTNRAVPRYPNGAYPDVKEPTFFDARDPRLDDPNVRTTIEQTLSAIVDRSSTSTREEMMAKFGLKPPKRFSTTYQPAMDTIRLETFREKWELLREVAETYAQINTRRNNSIIQQSWMIADISKFSSFIALTQEKVDYLIELMDVKEKVDRGLRMDIRIFGWHIVPDRARTAQDVSKLRLLQEICKQDYPEYLVATKQALENIDREAREMYPQYASPTTQYTVPGEPKVSHAQAHQKKRPGLFKLFRSFGKKDHQPARSGSASAALPSQEDPGPVRSLSDAGPDTSMGPALGRVRSKSVGYTEPPLGDSNNNDGDDDLRNRLEQMTTHEDTGEAQYEVIEPLKGPESVQVRSHETVDSPLEDSVGEMEKLSRIVRHDQYHGIARTETRDLQQPGADFGSG
ncbi:hypothetical protein CLAFUW4_13614 [Fulvia fulva]|uniref:Prion-inhibition and propagation HeLo domain-containing protein n=1 Tax=Passalora fulva TaxID=5499 RepID=A0A9Q8PKT8_PASFU|nr:uncharacterized protein CLAFUR5_13466 [Fulvia fulva]KAK4610254.1 hypothetical protein CLAFUR4_13617 [Fulvia fulva]KAK4611291.1 hypothetical protein CLAFUR0_13621 [Fulvia fulva]UJO24214.1 hypothetical protein CLAFUR5_13466 [Fulvia fulva]WPV21900.1 hypothetical protein CLAFUW4_13614 [Fulvia fulva]WPV37084.1 hypothetical protein CLAFUW7_13622 [Fulvia fulva]